MKEIELKLISALMNNSRVSDRELAKKLGVSQPTISRTRQKLEKEGYIGGYTIMPSLRRLGYQIIAMTFVRFRGDLDAKEAEKLRKRAQERFRDETFAKSIVMFERGMGFGYTGVIVSIHESYSAFAEFLRRIKQFEVLETDVRSFLTDLNDEVHYRTLTFAPLSHHLLGLKKKET